MENTNILNVRIDRETAMDGVLALQTLVKIAHREGVDGEVDMESLMALSESVMEGVVFHSIKEEHGRRVSVAV